MVSAPGRPAPQGWDVQRWEPQGLSELGVVALYRLGLTPWQVRPVSHTFPENDLWMARVTRRSMLAALGPRGPPGSRPVSSPLASLSCCCSRSPLTRGGRRDTHVTFGVWQPGLSLPQLLGPKEPLTGQ